MELILKLIAMISIFCFMCLAFRTNLREYKSYKEELIRDGKLASPRTRILSASKVYGIMIVSALILTMIVFYVRKLEFKIPMLFAGTLTIFCFECIIGGIGSLIQDMIQTYKKDGVLVAILSFVFIIGISASIVYVRYNW